MRCAVFHGLLEVLWMTVNRGSILCGGTCDSGSCYKGCKILQYASDMNRRPMSRGAVAMGLGFRRSHSDNPGEACGLS